MSACAQAPEAIQPAYVSLMTFGGMSCAQLGAESARVDSALVRASAQQRQARGNGTMGVILLDLPVSTLSGGNVAARITDLKDRQDVLHQILIQRGCIRG